MYSSWKCKAEIKISYSPKKNIQNIVKKYSIYSNSFCLQIIVQKW